MELEAKGKYQTGELAYPFTENGLKEITGSTTWTIQFSVSKPLMLMIAKLGFANMCLETTDEIQFRVHVKSNNWIETRI